uniref:cAMP responsive element binding protein 3 n=1 Tax=Steinernema glaseri TaxID=37863 RepID=A0A1I7YRG3_9BILA
MDCIEFTTWTLRSEKIVDLTTPSPGLTESIQDLGMETSQTEKVGNSPSSARSQNRSQPELLVDGFMPISSPTGILTEGSSMQI